MSLLLLFQGAGGATAYTLALDSVSWSWSATDVSLEYGREIVPGSVAWAWSATDVSPEHGREIIPEGATWSWSITDAALEKGWELVPDAVSWSWAATDASLERGFELVPGGVAWAWSATDVTLQYGANKQLAPDTIGWSWAATDVALEYGRELATEAPAWSWTVGDVTLNYGGASPQSIRPTGGFPLTYEEWARRTRKDEDEREESDAPPKPRVIEKIGVAQPVVETRAFIPSPPIETGLSELTKSEIRRRARLAKRRRQDDEWFLLN